MNKNTLNDNPPIVLTRYGLVEGTADGISRDGRQFYQFKGIQYAVVPERFEMAVEPSPWVPAIKPAKEFGNSWDNVWEHGDENSLFLNVFTSELGSPNGTLRPVVVYIHGGSFQYGNSANYGPNYWMDQDVVFVSINYRLGVLGFLSTGDENAPGNYGLKDQVMALRYIRDNIGGFGGDKDNVALTGQSAGSASVTYHLLSKMSRGLFHHAVAQSGTCLDAWALTRNPMRYAKRIAELLGCPDTSSSRSIVQWLKTVPAKTIANHKLARDDMLKFFGAPIAAFGPVIEPYIGDGSTTFLSQSPYELLSSGDVAKVPLLTGVVKEEGIYLWAAYLLFYEQAVEDRKNLHANWTKYAPLAFYFDEMAEPQHLQEIAMKVKAFYFPSGKFSLDDNSIFKQLSHIYSDRMFVTSAIRFINLYSRHAPTYPYLYTYNRFVGLEFEGQWKLLKPNYKNSDNTGTEIDATHAAELDMMLSPLFGRTRTDEAFDKVSKNVMKLWASFAKTGTPMGTYGAERNFPSVNPENGLQKWYRLDEDTELAENLFSDRTAFWESLGLKDNDFTVCYNC